MESWIDRVERGENRELVLQLLRSLETQGARVEIPPSERDSYLNVYAPEASGRVARVCSVTVATGRVELQDGAWTRLLDPAGYDRIGADKACRDLHDDADVAALIAAFWHEVGATGASASSASAAD